MKKDPLKIVELLAEVAELEKSRQVADSLVRLSAERERLALLEQYLSEYGYEAAAEVTDIESLNAKRGFLNALAQAIGDQSASVDQLNSTLERHIETWRNARANTAAVGKLTGRRSVEHARKRERAEQHELESRLHGQRGRGPAGH